MGLGWVELGSLPFVVDGSLVSARVMSVLLTVQFAMRASGLIAVVCFSCNARADGRKFYFYFLLFLFLFLFFLKVGFDEGQASGLATGTA